MHVQRAHLLQRPACTCRRQSSSHPARAALTRNCFGCTVSQTSAWITAPRLFTCMRQV